jgi:hypothetical protein
MSQQTIAPTTALEAGSRRPRVGSLVAGSIICVLAAVLLAGAGWALWKDRVDRDASGFVTIGTANLRTETSAIVGDLHGDGPGWLWESGVLGDSRVRATSGSPQPLFIGIARTDDLFRYLRGRGTRRSTASRSRPTPPMPAGHRRVPPPASRSGRRRRKAPARKPFGGTPVPATGASCS